MRKESKKRQTTTIARVQGYHSHQTHIGGNSESYAFDGFRGNWYFNSDRKEITEVRNGVLVRVDKNGKTSPLQGFGLEVETECNGIRAISVLAEVMEKIIFPRFKFGADMFKMQSDGSLGGATSVEVITQPMTKSRIRNDYSAWKAMFDDYFPSFRISSDSASTNCGMHVNVSNGFFGDTEEKQIIAIRKLYYIVNKHYDVCRKLFYRVRGTEWCHRMPIENARTLDLYHMSGSHGNSMNLSHFPAGRIEIRLVGGQRDYYCFRNTMESVFFLCERVRSISWADCDDIVKVFHGCNQYVIKRLVDCGLDSEAMETIRNNSKTKDLELHL